MSLADMKTEVTDRELVSRWLDKIGETDPACRQEVLDQCKTKEGRAYYVSRAKE